MHGIPPVAQVQDAVRILQTHRTSFGESGSAANEIIGIAHKSIAHKSIAQKSIAHKSIAHKSIAQNSQISRRKILL
jgi:hypothetical protein